MILVRHVLLEDDAALRKRHHHNGEGVASTGLGAPKEPSAPIKRVSSYSEQIGVVEWTESSNISDASDILLGCGMEHGLAHQDPLRYFTRCQGLKTQGLDLCYFCGLDSNCFWDIRGHG